MEKLKGLKELALSCGFSCAAELDPTLLVFREEVREMCSADRCGSYGRNWCCPPACPDLPEMRRRMKAYDNGVLVQTVAELEDDFDYITMMQAEKQHKENFDRLTNLLQERCGTEAVLPMGAGTCQHCPQCTYPDAPCRFPEKQIISVEAYGLLVSQVCESCGIPYYHGKGTLSYVSCIFIKKLNGEEGKNNG